VHSKAVKLTEWRPTIVHPEVPVGKTNFILKTSFLTALIAWGFGTLTSAWAAGPVETPYLIVHDGSGTLSHQEAVRFANSAEKTFEAILKFWAANYPINRFGKIRVEYNLPRGDRYFAVSSQRKEKDRRVRTVGVWGPSDEPHEMAHKLTHTLFPNKDKLIRNMMGIPTESRFGNYLSFPMCGFSNDDWVLALIELKSYISLTELGPGHEQWGMGFRGGLPYVTDRARQHASYTEAGSFGAYLMNTYGIEKMKAFNRFSHSEGRQWTKVFGLTLKDLETNWIKALNSDRASAEMNISTLKTFLRKFPFSPCLQAQAIANKSAGR
jgi:hypothetical protein